MTILEKIASAEVGSVAILESEEDITFFYRGYNDHGPCWNLEGCDYPIADSGLIPGDGEWLSIIPPGRYSQFAVEDD